MAAIVPLGVIAEAASASVSTDRFEIGDLGDLREANSAVVPAAASRVVLELAPIHASHGSTVLPLNPAADPLVAARSSPISDSAGADGDGRAGPPGWGNGMLAAGRSEAGPSQATLANAGDPTSSPAGHEKLSIASIALGALKTVKQKNLSGSEPSLSPKGMPNTFGLGEALGLASPKVAPEITMGSDAVYAMVYELEKQSHKSVILPNGPLSGRWDYVMIVLLTFTATVTPFEVAFLGVGLNDPTGRRDVLFAINRLVDLMFCIDICIQFNQAYQSSAETFADGARRNLITDRKMIALNYLKGWFIIDFISILPFDSIGQVENGTVADLKILRVIRLLRLFKLLRVFRVKKLLMRLEDRFYINSNWFTLVRFIIFILLLSHWFACAFHAVARFEDVPVGQDNWVDGYFKKFGLTEADLTPFQVYVAALYFSIVTISTTGYGDIVAVTDTERFFMFFELFVGAGCFAYLIGAVVNVITNLDKQNYDFMERLNILNNFMDELALPEAMRHKLRRFFRYRRRFQGAPVWKELLNEMSPAIRAEVSEYRIGPYLRNVHLLRGVVCPAGLVAEIASMLNISTFMKGDEVLGIGELHNKIYIIERGVVGGTGRMFLPGAVFGEEALMEAGRVCSHVLTALVVTDCFLIDGELMRRSVRHYPSVDKHIKAATLRRVVSDSLMSLWRKWVKLTNPISRWRAQSVALLIRKKDEVELTGVMGQLVEREKHVANFTKRLFRFTFQQGARPTSRSKPNIRGLIAMDGADGAAAGGSGVNMSLYGRAMRTSVAGARSARGLQSTTPRAGQFGGEGLSGDPGWWLSPMAGATPGRDAIWGPASDATAGGHRSVREASNLSGAGGGNASGRPSRRPSGAVGITSGGLDASEADSPPPGMADIWAGAAPREERPPNDDLLSKLAWRQLLDLPVASVLTALGASPTTVDRARHANVGVTELAELADDLDALQRGLGMSLGLAARARKFLRRVKGEEDKAPGPGTGGRGDRPSLAPTSSVLGRSGAGASLGAMLSAQSLDRESLMLD